MSLAKEIEDKMKGMLPDDFVVAKVQEVDESNYTCTIAEDGEEAAPYYDVRLKPVIESGDIGVIPVPKIDSWVLAAKIGEDKRSMAVIVPGEIDKYIIKTGDVYVEIGQIIKLNGDALGGLIKIEALVSRMNTIENAFAQLVTSHNTHTHTSPPAPSNPVVTTPPLVSSTANAGSTNKSNLENTKVKHG